MKRKKHREGKKRPHGKRLIVVSWDPPLLDYLWKLWAALVVGHELGPTPTDWPTMRKLLWESLCAELPPTIEALGFQRSQSLEGEAQVAGLTLMERARRQLHLIEAYVTQLAAMKDDVGAYTPWLAKQYRGLDYHSANASLGILLEPIGIRLAKVGHNDRGPALLAYLPTGERYYVDSRDGCVSPLKHEPQAGIYRLDEDHCRRFELYRPVLTESPFREGILSEILNVLTYQATKGFTNLPTFGELPAKEILPADLRRATDLELFWEMLDRCLPDIRRATAPRLDELPDDLYWAQAMRWVINFLEPLLRVVRFDLGSSIVYHCAGAIIQSRGTLFDAIHGERPLPDDLYPKANRYLGEIRNKLVAGGPELWRKLPEHFALKQAEVRFKQALGEEGPQR